MTTPTIDAAIQRAAERIEVMISKGERCSHPDADIEIKDIMHAELDPVLDESRDSILIARELIDKSTKLYQYVIEVKDVGKYKVEEDFAEPIWDDIASYIYERGYVGKIEP